jgi:hypothetical protein
VGGEEELAGRGDRLGAAQEQAGAGAGAVAGEAGDE